LPCVPFAYRHSPTVLDAPSQAAILVHLPYMSGPLVNKLRHSMKLHGCRTPPSVGCDAVAGIALRLQSSPSLTKQLHGCLAPSGLALQTSPNSDCHALLPWHRPQQRNQSVRRLPGLRTRTLPSLCAPSWIHLGCRTPRTPTCPRLRSMTCVGCRDSSSSLHARTATSHTPTAVLRGTGRSSSEMCISKTAQPYPFLHRRATPGYATPSLPGRFGLLLDGRANLTPRGSALLARTVTSQPSLARPHLGSPHYTMRGQFETAMPIPPALAVHRRSTTAVPH
jgi:hypothetical protein